MELRTVLMQPKRLAVLVWLASARPAGFHSRDTMLALFWPDAVQERGRNSLRQGLHFLRRALGEDVVVNRGDREVGLDPDRIWCDAAAFDAALAAKRPEEALDLYRGDFLPGFFIDEAPEAERWLEDERDRRRREAVEAALGLVRRDEAAGDLRAAAGWARRAGLIVPADETVHRTLLGLLERAGDHAAALDAHEQFAKRLEAEYGLPVGKETAAIVERIRARPRGAAPAAIPETPAALPPAAEATGTGLPAPTVPPSAPAAAAEPSPPARRRARSVLIDLAFVALVVLAIGLSLRKQSRPAAPAENATPAIAVLPFENRTGDAENDFLADGLADEVINGLGQLQGLKVMARSSSFAWKGKAVTPDSIARALGVTHLVEGSLRRMGDSLRVTATLLDAASGAQRWSRSWDGNARDLLAFETAISRGVAEALSPVLGREASASEPDTRDPALRERLLRTRLRSRQLTELQPTIDSVVAILRTDSTYARAWAFLGLYSVFQAYTRQAPAADAYARAVTYARRAIALRPDIPESYTVLGRVAEGRDWDFREADRMYAKAAALRPSDARAYVYRTFLMLRLGRFDDALQQARKTIELDPLSPASWNALGAVHHLRRQYDSATVAYRAALDIQPTDISVLTNLALVAGDAGRMAEAQALLDSAKRRAPTSFTVQATETWLLARAGRRAEAIARTEAQLREPNASPSQAAIIFAMVGDRARALALLERAAADRDDRFPDLGMTAEFDVLKNEPRFRALQARLGVVER